MTDATALAGFIGTTLVIFAYVPQIHHLVLYFCTKYQGSVCETHRNITA